MAPLVNNDATHSTQIVTLRFKKNWRLHMPGDVAGVKAKTAAVLVAAGVATVLADARPKSGASDDGDSSGAVVSSSKPRKKPTRKYTRRAATAAEYAQADTDAGGDS